MCFGVLIATCFFSPEIDGFFSRVLISSRLTKNGTGKKLGKEFLSLSSPFVQIKLRYVENGFLCTMCLMIYSFFNQGQFLDSSNTSCLHGLLCVSLSSASSYLEYKRSFCYSDSSCGSLRATFLLGAQEVPWRLSFHPLSFTTPFVTCTRIFYR